MSYVNPNYQSKKALKDAIANGDSIEVFQPGPFGPSVNANGTVYLEGPHYPKPHKWYAVGTMQDGKLIKIK